LICKDLRSRTDAFFDKIFRNYLSLDTSSLRILEMHSQIAVR